MVFPATTGMNLRIHHSAFIVLPAPAGTNRRVGCAHQYRA